VLILYTRCFASGLHVNLQATRCHYSDRLGESQSYINMYVCDVLMVLEVLEQHGYSRLRARIMPLRCMGKTVSFH
jgi:hypothetical protein